MTDMRSGLTVEGRRRKGIGRVHQQATRWGTVNSSWGSPFGFDNPVPIFILFPLSTLSWHVTRQYLSIIAFSRRQDQ